MFQSVLDLFQEGVDSSLVGKRIGCLKKEIHDPNLYRRFLAYSREGKQNSGNRSASAPTNDDMEYNNKIYKEIFSKCQDKHSPAEFFWAIKNKDDVLDEDDDIPKEGIYGHKCYNIYVETLREPFKPSKNPTGNGKTDRLKRPPLPSYLQFSQPRNSKALLKQSRVPNVEFGIWKLCKVWHEAK